MKKKVFALVLVLSLIALTGLWAGGGRERDAAPEDRQVTVAFVSNGPYTFWTYAHAGVIRAEQQFGVNVEFYKPPSATLEEQVRFIETMMARGIDGLAISVIDPVNMTPFLDDIGADIPVVTFDSDAPDSVRRAYVGMSNYAAGRLAGEKVREALPNGGNVMLFVGRMDAQNAIERRQGIIDELKGEPFSSTFPGQTSPAGRVAAGAWTILDTRTDGGDESRAKANVEDSLVRHGADIDLMIGLWSYNTPAIISAVEDAGLLGAIQIIGFDEEEVVLQGIRDGYVRGTVVQNPFEYGRKSVELLTMLATGQDPGIPQDKLVDVPARFITNVEVDDYARTLASQLAVGEFFEQ